MDTTSVQTETGDVPPVGNDVLLDGTVIGHRIGGTLMGPQVLVAGLSPISEVVFQKLLDIPTLASMRGQLTLVSLTKIDAFGLDVGDAGIGTQTPDEVMFLPYDPNPSHHDQVVNEGYWAVLRLCTQLGMIAGRGVPPTVTLDMLET